MVTQLRYKCREPLDGFGDDGVRHRVVVPARSEFNSSNWDVEIPIKLHDADAERLAKEIVVAVNEHLTALAFQVVKEIGDLK